MTELYIPILSRSEPESAAERITGTGQYRLGYFLFLLVNATLFIRPGEIFPATEGWPLYNVLILASLVASLPAVLKQLEWRALVRNPAILCVIGLIPAVAFSHLSHGNAWSARVGMIDFSKVVIYFLILVGLIDSLPRVRHFLGFTTICILVTAILALLKYHGVIQMDAMAVLQRGDHVDMETGEMLLIQQLQASGIFSDPNDFSVILATAILAVVYFVSTATTPLYRTMWVLASPILIYAFALTKSRGGFLSLLAGVGAFMVVQLGWRRSLWWSVLLLPIMLILFGGRQTDINIGNTHDTGQGRILLWREGLAMFRAQPFFGTGFDTYGDKVGQVAHNSYVHGYVELGFFGGTLFLMAFVLPLQACRKAAFLKDLAADGYALLRPCIFAIVLACAVGLFSLSRNSSTATYLVLGIGCAFTSIVTTSGGETVLTPLSGRLAIRSVYYSIAMLGVLYCFTRFLVF